MASHEKRSSPRQGFLHGAVILTAGTILAKIVGALFKIPLTRMIGTEGAGHFNAAYNIYIVLLNISSTGLPLAVSRLISEADALKQPERLHAVRRMSLMLFWLIGTVSGIGMFPPVIWFEKFAAKASSRGEGRVAEAVSENQ